MNQKELEHKLDSLIQEKASQHRCYYCGTSKNVVGHHLIRRANLMYRWDVNNILPVCVSCHRKIHDGFLVEPAKITNTTNFRDYLLKNGLTEEEFLIQKYFELTGQKVELEKKEVSLIHKPKVKSPKNKALLEKNRKYRHEQYLRFKKMKSKFVNNSN